MPVKGYFKSVIGGRSQNQDAVLCLNDRSLFAVADGVGGGMKGEVASQMAVDGLKELSPNSIDLHSLVEKLQDRVLNEALTTLGEALMGTTLTCGLVSNGVLYLCHVGDSRCYLFENNMLRQLTEDHEMFDEVYQAPVLASYLGMPKDLLPVKIQDDVIPLKAGMRLIFCSDGLYKQIEETRMAIIIRENLSSPQRIVDLFCEEAVKAEHSDNVSVVYVEIE